MTNKCPCEIFAREIFHLVATQQTCEKMQISYYIFVSMGKLNYQKRKTFDILFRFGTKRFLQNLGLCVADLRRKIGTKLTQT